MFASALGEKQEESEDHDGNHGQHNVEEHLAHPRGTPLLPILEFGPIFHTYLIGMLQIMRKFRRSRITIFGIALERTIDDLLKLRRDTWIELARRNRVVQQPVIHDGEGIRTLKRSFAREHFIEHHAQSKNIAAAVASLAFHLFW